MLLLKYFENFNDDDNKLSKKVYDLQNDNEFNANKYVESEESYRFVYYSDDYSHYKLQIYPQFEICLITYPDSAFNWTACNAIEKNEDYFRQDVFDSEFYDWLLFTVTNYKSIEIPSITFKTTKLLSRN